MQGRRFPHRASIVRVEEQEDANYQTWTPLDLDKRPKIPQKFTLNLNDCFGSNPKLNLGKTEWLD